MRRLPFIILGMIALPIMTVQSSYAADGKLAAAVHMYAGPGPAYPELRRLAKGLSVDIHGCLKSWDWCDVTWRGNRGWVPAAAVDTHRDDERRPVKDYGAQMGVPEVTFQLNSYWDANYNRAIFYRDRSNFMDVSARFNVQ
jgi:uncharacterized protein YraI